MAFTETQIISRIAELLGEAPVTSLSGASSFVTSIVDWYHLLVEVEIAARPWRFATKVQELSKSVETPVIDKYKYIYVLPGDYLALWQFYPDNRDYRIYGSEVYSNADSLKIEYRYLPPTYQFPNYFVNYIAAVVAEAQTINAVRSAELAQTINQFKTLALGIGLYTDAQSNPNESMSANSFISVRR